MYINKFLEFVFTEKLSSGYTRTPMIRAPKMRAIRLRASGIFPLLPPLYSRVRHMQVRAASSRPVLVFAERGRKWPPP